MTQGNRKPEGGVSALRVRISRMLDRTNIEQATAKRNAEHFEISRTPHVWLDALSATNLPSSAFRIAIRLAQTFLNKGNGFCYPSIETLARVCDLPLRTARDGLDALRAKGFIITQKIGTHDPLFFFFAVPSRVAEIRHSEESVPRVENSHSRVSNFRRATNVESSTGNHREEPERGTIEDTGVPCGPPSAVVANAPPVDLPASPTDLPRTAAVVGTGQPSDFHPEREEEEPIECPPERAAQLAIVKAISGEMGRGGDRVNQQLLELLRAGELTPSKVVSVVAAWKVRSAEDAA